MIAALTNTDVRDEPSVSAGALVCSPIPLAAATPGPRAGAVTAAPMHCQSRWQLEAQSYRDRVVTASSVPQPRSSSHRRRALPGRRGTRTSTRGRARAPRAEIMTVFEISYASFRNS